MTSWARKRIGELVEPVRNWNPSRSQSLSSFTYIDIGSVDQDSKTITCAKVLPCSEAPSRARQLVKCKDVLVSTVRPNLNAVAFIDERYDGAVASTGFCVLRPIRERLSEKYLFQWVKFQAFIDSMAKQATGASYPAVSDNIVRNSIMPLPPLPEQRRIAAILDQAEAVRAKRREALCKLEGLAQAVFVEMFGDPVRNPKGWPRLPFGEVLESIDSGKSPICLDRPATDHERGILKLGAITWCEFDSEQNKALPSEVKLDSKMEIRSGDILFSRKNTQDLVAACAIVGSTRPGLFLPDLIFRLNLNKHSGMSAIFLHQLLINVSKRKEIQKLAGGSAGSMPNISKDRLRSALIENPPLKMQQSYARRVEVIGKLKAGHRASLAKLDALFASLQHRAFRGEL